MKIEYDKDHDLLYIQFQQKKVAKSKEIEKNIILDLDQRGRLIGIEVLDPSKIGNLKDLLKLQVKVYPHSKIAA